MMGRLLPETAPVASREAIRATICVGLAVALTIFLCRLFLQDWHLPFLIASTGASAMLVFVVPHSPMAQPWAIVVGQLVAGIVGVACAKLFADPAIAAGLAVAATLGLMYPLRCLHPPGGATAVITSLGGEAIQQMGFQFVLVPILVNMAVLLALAVLIHRVARRPYPTATPPSNRHGIADPAPTGRVGITAGDLDVALTRTRQWWDIAPSDLHRLLAMAGSEAVRARLGGLRCADIMSRDVVAITPDTAQLEAWRLLRHHKIKALPVIDAERKVVGIITLVDYLKRIELDHLEDAEAQIRHWFGGWASVDAIMTLDVVMLGEDAQVVDTVALLSDRGLHHIPIVDEFGRLSGMVTQSDMIAGLYGELLVMVRPA
jgi:CBS domain-containing membrane protein